MRGGGRGLRDDDRGGTPTAVAWPVQPVQAGGDRRARRHRAGPGLARSSVKGGGDVSRSMEGWTSFSLVLAGFGVFPGTFPVVWAAPVVTTGLLGRHASLCAALAPFGIHPHFHPGHRVPHVTLNQEGPSSARAIEIVTSMWNGPMAARLERVELVRFLPAAVLWSQRLSPAG